LKLMKENNFQFLPLLKLPLIINLYNIKFALHWYRVIEFFRKKLYSNYLASFLYGVKLQ